MSDQNKAIRDKVFVGGLDYSMRESELRDHFEKFGKLKDY